MKPYSLQDFIKILEQKGCRITRNKLRHYEREGLVRPIRQKREERDRWFYTDDDVETVIAITNLISLSWKAKEVSALLRLSQEINAVVERMKKTSELFFDIFRGTVNIADIKDQSLLDEIEFWKKFEGGFQAENVLKIVAHYVPGLNMQSAMVATYQMLDRMERGVFIVSKFQEKILNSQSEITKLHSEIYHHILNISKG